MSDLYPLLLVPEFHERIWGTRDLSPIYREAPGTAPIGEAWLTADTCKVANGPLAGATLGELCRRYGRELVGGAARETDRFPLLIKFLFPREKLSVQVHPDDEGARRLGQPCGKTECWYVVGAEPGAQIGLGLKPGVTKAQFEQAIRETRAEELMNWLNIHPGEMIYVDAGTVHAIGSGSILVETQQNSDTTFRLYDYGRPRELHVEQGLVAVKERTRAGKVRSKRAVAHCTELVSAPSFSVAKVALGKGDQLTRHKEDEPGQASVTVLVALGGSGVFEHSGPDPLSFNRGEAVVVPACIPSFSVRAQWDVEFLTMKLPLPGGIAEPVTSL